MKQFLITVAGVFVGLAIFMIGVPFLLISAAAGALAPAPLPAKAVIAIDLRGAMTDQDAGLASMFQGGSTSVISILDTLRRAEKDERIKGVLVRLPEGGMTPAAADELRLGFKHFRASGALNGVPRLRVSRSVGSRGSHSARMRLLEDGILRVPLHQEVAQPAGAVAHQSGVEDRISPVFVIGA